MPLTETAIRKAKPADKPLRLFDSAGLNLEVAPSGCNWRRLNFQHDGKEERFSLGTYSADTGLKDAREKRDKARKQLSDGIEPSARIRLNARLGRRPN